MKFATLENPQPEEEAEVVQVGKIKAAEDKIDQPDQAAVNVGQSQHVGNSDTLDLKLPPVFDLPKTVPQPQTVAPQAPVQPMMSGTVGDRLSSEIAGVLTMPFTVLSTASRHLARGVGHGVSVAANKIHVERTTVSPRRLARIEQAEAAVAEAAYAMKKTPEFVVAEDAATQASKRLGMSVGDVIGRMGHDPDLAAVKERYDRLWSNCPDQVSKYRSASKNWDDAVSGLESRFAGSDSSTKARINSSMSTVAKQASGLPGFGEQQGEYIKGLAERVRELAERISSLISALVQRVSSGASAGGPSPS